MGVAGSGKSMQGRLLADQEALPWLSTGEFLRMLISGDERRDMLAGKLLDDEEIITLVQKIFNIVDTDEEFVLDGFPRTESQADWLLNQVKYGQLSVTAVIHLIATESSVMERLLDRGRQDDHAEAIRERFQEYEVAIKPVMSHFKEAKIPIYDINGEQEPKKVHSDIISVLGRS
ncbi:nucleoside monophosphate kinase [Candidatus Saccharibacteria bacterium]|nr:nucleoside monophosphate kinase [Candidatus Saccharibacteria bacterium]